MKKLVNIDKIFHKTQKYAKNYSNHSLLIVKETIINYARIK